MTTGDAKTLVIHNTVMNSLGDILRGLILTRSRETIRDIFRHLYFHPDQSLDAFSIAGYARQSGRWGKIIRVLHYALSADAVN